MKFIPKNFYVGIRSDNMGFMTTTVKEGFTGRKKTVDNWCNSWVYNPKTNLREKVGGKTLEINNGFKTGFKVIVNDRRYRTDNVVWNVEHPEGFVFQITSENFCDLLQEDTLVNGVLQGEYCFIRNGSNNELIVKNSSKLTGVKTQKEIETKISTSKLEIGDKVQLKSHGNSEFVYLGAFHFMPSLIKGLNKKEKPDFSEDFKTVKRHVFRKVGSNKFSFDHYTTLASPKVLSVLEKNFEKVSFDDCYEELKKSLCDFEENRLETHSKSAIPVSLTDSQIIGISKKPTKLSQMKNLLIEIPESVSFRNYYYFSDRLLVDTSKNNIYPSDSAGLNLFVKNHSGFIVYSTMDVPVKEGNLKVPVLLRTHYSWFRSVLFNSRSSDGAMPKDPVFIQLLVGE